MDDLTFIVFIVTGFVIGYIVVGIIAGYLEE